MKTISKVALLFVGVAILWGTAFMLFSYRADSAYTSESRTFRELSGGRYAIAWGTTTLTSGTVSAVDTGLGFVTEVLCTSYESDQDRVSCIRSATTTTPEVVNILATGTKATTTATWFAIGVGKHH